MLSLANSDRPTKHLPNKSSSYCNSQIPFYSRFERAFGLLISLPIALRVIRHGTPMFDLIMLHYLSHIFVHKWSTIVTIKLVRYAKASDDMLSYKVCHSNAGSLLEWDCLHPLSKILSGYKNPNMSARSWIDRTN